MKRLLLAAALALGLGISPAFASSSIGCNGNTYTWPDQFLNYGYVQNWPLLVNDCITDMAGKVTSASDSATTATTQATNAANSAASAATYAAATVDTSATSTVIGTGSKTFTVSAGKQFAAGQFVSVVSRANNANYLHGQVTSYSGTTLVVNVLDVGGSGTYADWNVSISGSQGATGAIGATGPNTIAIQKDGGAIGTRGTLNLITGANTTLTVADNSGSNRVDVTVAASAPPLSLISTQTASNSADLHWTGLGTTYNNYKLVCSNVINATNGLMLYAQVGEGSTPTWETSGYAYAASGTFMSSSPTAQLHGSGSYGGIPLDGGGGVYNSASSNIGLNGEYIITNIPAVGAGYTSVTGVVTTQTSSGAGNTMQFALGGAYLTDTTAKTAIRVIPSSGNIASGQCSLYGISN